MIFRVDYWKDVAFQEPRGRIRVSRMGGGAGEEAVDGAYGLFVRRCHGGMICCL